jgi:hypothetical protein
MSPTSAEKARHKRNETCQRKVCFISCSGTLERDCCAVSSSVQLGLRNIHSKSEIGTALAATFFEYYCQKTLPISSLFYKHIKAMESWPLTYHRREFPLLQLWHTKTKHNRTVHKHILLQLSRVSQNGALCVPPRLADYPPKRFLDFVQSFYAAVHLKCYPLYVELQNSRKMLQDFLCIANQ